MRSFITHRPGVRLGRRGRVVGLVLASVLAASRPTFASTEFVVILDNSGSMINGAQDPSGKQLPPADPDRLSVLATLILDGLVRPPDDLSILAFAPGSSAVRQIPRGDTAKLRAIPYDASTRFEGPFRRAMQIFRASQHDRRILLFLTDGLPEDLADPMEARRVLELEGGTTRGPDYELIVLGLSPPGQDSAHMDRYLSAVVGKDGAYHAVGDPKALVASFTSGYARALGSRPKSTVVKGGASEVVELPRYVSRALVVAASVDRTSAMQAQLRQGGRSVSPRVEGDNDCAGMRIRPSNNRRVCEPPFHQYSVWEIEKDPDTADHITLDAAGGEDVAFGVVLEYELRAELVKVPEKTRVGSRFEVVGRLVWKNQTFDDVPFFSADGFEAEVVYGRGRARMSRRADGHFEAILEADEVGPLPVSVVFRNDWMERRSPVKVVRADDFAPLQLRVQPIELGAWAGSWRGTHRCGQLELRGTDNPGRVVLELVAQTVTEGVTLRVDGAPLHDGAALSLPTQTVDAEPVEVCVLTRGCCGASRGADVELMLRGKHAHYHAGAVRVPLRFEVAETTWLVCLLPYLVAAGIILFIIFVVRGVVGPNAFDALTKLRVSKKEARLARSTARLLVEQPGGRRGFYRDAAVGIDASGNSIRNRRRAVVRLVAASGGEIKVQASGPLEVKKRGGQWEQRCEADNVHLRRKMVYRVGDLFFRLD